MGYNIVPSDQIELRNNALGISYSSDRTTIFTSITTDILQARENLINLLLTKKGERVLNPDFGSELLYVLFEPNIDSLKEVVIDIITTAVERQLPYIVLNEIDVATFETDPNLQNSIRVKITFSVSSVERNAITLTASNSGRLTVE